MCGRYVLDDIESMNKEFGIAPIHNYNVTPGQEMPVIRKDDYGAIKLNTMRWGLIPSWSKTEDIGYKMINARSETVFDRPSWRDAIKQRRCLIPANGFYEWRRDGLTKNQPYYITLRDSKLFYFAGIWDIWRDEDGRELRSYSILTTAPNKEMSAIHDRMPVILHKKDEQPWIYEDDRGFIEHVTRPYDDDSLIIGAVSKDVNVVKNNDGHLIVPINSK